MRACVRAPFKSQLLVCVGRRRRRAERDESAITNGWMDGWMDRCWYSGDAWVGAEAALDRPCLVMGRRHGGNKFAVMEFC